MSWNARLRAALHGDVDGSDVAALLAASHPLADMRQQLADRRLASEVAHAGEEWRVLDEVGPVSACLWLAESLLALAQSLAEAEAEDHPDMRSMMSVASHDQALALLQPLSSMAAEVGAALADPSYQPNVPLPVGVLPLGGSPEASLPPSLPLAYVRGLLRGAERVEGSASATLADSAGLVSRSTPPEWLLRAMQTLHGELASVGVRSEMMRVRMAPVLHQQRIDEESLHYMAADLWQVLDAYVHIGQLASVPRLLSGPSMPIASAPPATPLASAPEPPYTTQSWADASPPRPTAPPPDPGATPSQDEYGQRQRAGRPAPALSPAVEQARPLPQIGGGRWPDQRSGDQHPAPRRPTQAVVESGRSEQESHDLPSIGAAPQSQASVSVTRHAPATARPPHTPAHDAAWDAGGYKMPRVGAAPAPSEDEARPLPRIGPSAPREETEG